MKRIVLVLLACITASGLFAQKYAVVNTENLFSGLKEYTAAQEQVDKLREQYQALIQSEYDNLETMFQQYQQEKGSLSAEQKKTRQGAIVDRENKVKELQEQYFGQEGVLSKTSETLFTPIRERVMNTIDKVAKANDCALVLDVAGGMGVIYYVPDIDITDQVLKSLQLGN